MSTPWVVAFVVLAIMVVLLAVFVLGLAQRLVEVLRRVEALLGDPTAAPNGVGLAIGAEAPSLPQSRTVDGAEAEESAADAVVLFVEHDCDPCRVLVTDLRGRQPELSGLRPVLVSAPTVGWADALAGRWELLADSDRTAFADWRVAGTPLAYVVGADGRIRTKSFPNSAADVTALCSQAGQHGDAAAHVHMSAPSPSR